jgi:tRNA-(ms[2]io[6]A)-hydroxylase
MLCLAAASDDEWAGIALGEIDAVLIDHAHCELKAASNATSLIARYPGQPAVVRALAALAAEELDHFQRVLVLMDERGLTLGPPSVDAYARELRRAAQTLVPLRVSPLVDRLLVGALIEARSCERFKLLATALERRAPGRLADFYAELLAAEARHYRVLVDLACETARGDLDEAGVLERLAQLALLEADIVARLAKDKFRATIHG